MSPRNGMNGTPFSAAWSMVWIAGHVASRTKMRPSRTAAVKRGAKPASPSDTALVSTSATQPAPINRSVAKPETGTPSSRSARAPRRTRAMASATDGSELSGGIVISAPSGTLAAIAARLISDMRPCDWKPWNTSSRYFLPARMPFRFKK